MIFLNKDKVDTFSIDLFCSSSHYVEISNVAFWNGVILECDNNENKKEKLIVIC